MTVTYEPKQKVGPYTLTHTFGPRIGSEAWLARDGENQEVMLRIVSQPEVQIILRELSEHLEELEKLELPSAILPLCGCNPFAEPPYTSEPFRSGLRTLRNVLLETSPLPFTLALIYFHRILDSYEELLSAGQFHGALLPENILISDANGDATICGLGWGRVATLMLRRGVLPPEKVRSALAGYFAPEQLTSPAGFAPPADFYTLGVLLFEMLTGQPPVIDSEGLLPPLAGLGEVPTGIRKALEGLLRPEPNSRLCSIEELRALLPAAPDGAHAGDGEGPKVDTSPKGLRHPRLACPDMIAVDGGEAELPVPPSIAGQPGVSTDLRRSVEAFWLARHPITTQQYCLFLRQRDVMRINDWVEVGDYGLIEYAEEAFVPRRGFGNYPLIGVSRAGAEAFCEWLSEQLELPFRLPTMAEWLVAAGTPTEDGPWWPWGDDAPTPERACFGRLWRLNHFQVLPPVDTLTAGASPSGIAHVAGTVAEWTASSLADFVEPGAAGAIVFGGTGERIAAPDAIGVVAGGSWRDDPDDISPRRIRFLPPRYVRPTIGFRIATSVDPASGSDEE